MRILKEGEREYENLETAVGYLLHRTYGMIFNIEDTYFDFGADISWTTIIAENLVSGSGHWQMLSPRDWKELTNATDYKEITEIIDRIVLNSDLYNVCKCENCKHCKKDAICGDGFGGEKYNYCKCSDAIAYDQIVEQNYFCGYFLKKEN